VLRFIGSISYPTLDRNSEVVKCSEVLQCSFGLRNKVSNIIRRHTDNMGLLLIYNLLLSHSFIFNVYLVVFLFN
jgi:hypothetical protein